LSGILDKAEAFATARNIAPAVLLDAPLSPDMLPLLKQVCIACDFAQGTAARRAGQEVPILADDETSLRR